LRATLFHFGVIRALRSTEINGSSALSRVSEIYSVSGGSILAAHMVLNWQDYTSDDEEAFDRVEDQILAFAQRNIRDRVLRRSALTFLPLRLRNLFAERYVSGRSFWLMREYDRLYKRAKLEVFGGSKGRPSLNILATNFRTGDLCSFSDDRFEMERDGKALVQTPSGHLSVGRAVAASSAFPPMFPALMFDDKLLARPRDDEFLHPVLLSDGGVFDNVGIEKLMARRKRHRNTPKTIVISNAGSPFRADAAKTYAGPLSRNVRASDILMRRVGSLAEQTFTKAIAAGAIDVRLSTPVANGSIADTVQQTLRLVRTDLDRFSPEVCQLLVDLGKDVARQEFRKQNWSWIEPIAVRSRVPVDRSRQQRVAERAAKRSFWALPFDFGDPIPLLVLWAIAITAGGLGYSVWNTYSAAKLAERQAITERLALQEQQTAKLNQATEALQQGNYSALNEILLGGAAESRAAQEETRREIEPDQAPIPQSEQVEVPAQRVDYAERVYIQFAGSLTRDQIVSLNQALRENGWNVQGPSGERITSAAGYNEVRYGGNNQEAAARLAGAISAAGIASRPLRATRADIVGPRNLEVWMSN